MNMVRRWENWWQANCGWRKNKTTFTGTARNDKPGISQLLQPGRFSKFSNEPDHLPVRPGIENRFRPSFKTNKQNCMKRYYCAFLSVCFLLAAAGTKAQTDMDAIMMGRKQLCIGPMFSHSSWTNYWEGTLKRDNLNLGKVSTSMYALMGAYGVTDNLNLLFGVRCALTEHWGELRDLLDDSARIARQEGIAKPGELIAVTAGLPDQELGTNLFEIHRVPG